MPTPANILTALDADAALDQASKRAHRLVLVVGRAASGKTTLLRLIAKQRDIPLLNLGLDLSRNLLKVPARDRKLQAPEITAKLLDDLEAPIIAVDNTEIIFDPSLMLNPLGLLQNLSRTRLLVWSWNGALEDGHVTYATPGHPEYQRMPVSGITLIVLGEQ